MDQPLILAIDQGTSSTKTLIFNRKGEILAKGVVPLKSYYPEMGFVEQDPLEIYQNVLDSVNLCINNFKEQGGDIQQLNTCGISNQRETLVVWDENGVPLHPAVVWQCKRSVNICNRMQKQGWEDEIQEVTGLIIDPYFSGTKMIWLYENDQKVQQAVDQGRAYFGNVDTWLLFKLTGGKSYFTDYTNASRTLFFDLQKLKWHQPLLDKFNLTKLNLPQPVASAYVFGSSDFEGLLPHKLSITGMIGDSHAAAFGEGCYQTGTAKATLGTGSSLLLNAGSKPTFSNRGVVSTICWSIHDRVDYALEGVIVTCGATIEWLKNQLGLFSASQETEKMAQSVTDNGGVYLIPAFSGLGAPHWKMDAQAMIAGLTFGVNKNHLVRAALESIPFQIKDIITVMEQEIGVALKELKIDGGIAANQLVVQLLADLLNARVSNIGMTDVSALGAALIAGFGSGMYQDIADLDQVHQPQKITRPAKNLYIEAAYKGWQQKIAAYYP